MNTNQNAESLRGKAGNADAHIDNSSEQAKRKGSEAIDATRASVNRNSARAETALHKAADATADAAHRATQRASELGEKGREKWDEGRVRTEEGIDQAMEYVRANPGKAVAFAVAGGWLLGALMRHRR